MPTEILGLDVLVAGQPQKEVTVNTALRQIEGWVRALSITTTAPPGLPTAGDTYIVPADATGAWAGQGGKLAHYYGGSWKFKVPPKGITTVVLDEGDAGVEYLFNNDGEWVPNAGDTSAFLTHEEGDAAYEALGAATAAVTAHVAASDPHPQYLTPTEGNAAYDAAGAAAAAVAAHAAAADPHPTYLTQAEGDARYTATGAGITYSPFVASGSGHAAGLVPDPGATAGTTKFLREDGAWSVPPGVTVPVNAGGTNPQPMAKMRCAKTEWQSVAASATQTLLNYTGGSPGYISYLFIALSSTDALARAGSLIKIYIDGESTPSVSVPLDAVFLGAFAPTKFQSRYVGYAGLSGSNTGGYLYINAPFASGVKIDFVNASTTTAVSNLWASINYHIAASAPNWDRYKRLKNFQQGYSSAVTPTKYTEVDLLNVTGRGVLWGLQLLIDSADSNFNCLEGNIKIYVDGNLDIENSGTEDWFNGTFYFQEGTYASDFAGCVLRDASNFRVNMYRWHVLDAVPFDTSLRVTWTAGESAHATVTNNPTIYSNAWYYLDT